MHPVMAALDADHDGTVSAQELAAAPKALRQLDQDGDGVLSAEELRPRFGRERERPAGGGNANDMVNTLMAFDQNGDGMLQKSEVPERMQGLFARGDADKNGTLTREELQKLSSASAAQEGNRGGGGRFRDQVVAALDKDGDGSLNAAEIAAASASLAALDRNRDGAITEDEVRPQFGPGGRGGPGGARRDPAEMAAHMMEEWDKNGDAKLTKDEMPERMQFRFTEADTDGNGSLSKAELQAMMAAGFRGGRQ